MQANRQERVRNSTVLFTGVCFARTTDVRFHRIDEGAVCDGARCRMSYRKARDETLELFNLFFFRTPAVPSRHKPVIFPSSFKSKSSWPASCESNRRRCTICAAKRKGELEMQHTIREARRACLAIAVSALCASCRQPPPPPAGPPPPQPGTAMQVFSRAGTIRSWNYGPNGDINGFVLDRDVLVMFPPDVAASFTRMARLGSRIGVSGYSHSGLNVSTVVNAQTITLNGQTFNIPPPPPPAERGRRGPPLPPPGNAPPPPPPPGPQGPPPGPQL